jgi:hypothetical protein
VKVITLAALRWPLQHPARRSLVGVNFIAVFDSTRRTVSGGAVLTAYAGLLGLLIWGVEIYPVRAALGALGIVGGASLLCRKRYGLPPPTSVDTELAKRDRERKSAQWTALGFIGVMGGTWVILSYWLSN